MKSHVSMEQYECVVCAKHYDTGAILLDKRLKDSLEGHTCTGIGLCPEHKAEAGDEYVWLVCATRDSNGDTMRTGDNVRVRRAVWSKMFNAPIPPNGIGFIEPEAFERLRAMTGHAQPLNS